MSENHWVPWTSDLCLSMAPLTIFMQHLNLRFGGKAPGKEWTFFQMLLLLSSFQVFFIAFLYLTLQL